MPKADLGDLQIYYEVHGEGPPVLLVPGLGGVGAYWQPNIPAFAAKHRWSGAAIAPRRPRPKHSTRRS
ncbi:MAG: alpha/beta fold hydrolase [Burkholderiales bacterium]